MSSITVLDFRRQRMSLRWDIEQGLWSADESAAASVHGVALIRPTQPNFCVFAQGGTLKLQIGLEQYALSESSPLLKCERDLVSLGYRRRFSVVSATGTVLFAHRYWVGSNPDFFKALAEKAMHGDWRSTAARTWSEGVVASVLREAWTG